MSKSFTPELRKLYAEKTLDLTNIGVGATLFGQFISDKGISVSITIVGFSLLVAGYIISFIIYPKK